MHGADINSVCKTKHLSWFLCMKESETSILSKWTQCDGFGFLRMKCSEAVIWFCHYMPFFVAQNVFCACKWAFDTWRITEERWWRAERQPRRWRSGESLTTAARMWAPSLTGVTGLILVTMLDWNILMNDCDHLYISWNSSAQGPLCGPHAGTLVPCSVPVPNSLRPAKALVTAAMFLPLPQVVKPQN